MVRGFVWEKVAGWQALLSCNFFPYKSSYHSYISDTLKTASKFYIQYYRHQAWQFYYFFLLFSFLIFTKCQVLNLRVGKSRDQVLAKGPFKPIMFSTKSAMIGRRRLGTSFHSLLGHLQVGLLIKDFTLGEAAMEKTSGFLLPPGCRSLTA